MSQAGIKFSDGNCVKNTWIPVVLREVEILNCVMKTSCVLSPCAAQQTGSVAFDSSLALCK